MFFKQLTIRTSKQEEEIKFMQEFCGLSIEEDLRPIGEPIVFMKDAEGATRLEIIQVPNFTESGSAALSIGFVAGDVAEQRLKLLAAGYEVSEIISPVSFVQFVLTTDPAGHTVQFLNA